MTSTARQGFPIKTASSIESLSTELLLRITDDVDHEDIQNFARCCPIVWNTVENVFGFHKRRRRYHSVLLGSFDNFPEPFPHPLEVLRDVVMDDGLAIYPKEMIITSRPVTLESQREVAPPNLDLLPEHRDRILDLIKKSRYFPAEKWYNMVTNTKNPAAISGLLLSLFPNLRSIELRNSGILMSFLGTIVRWIACAARLNRLTVKPITVETGNYFEKKEKEWDPNEAHALSNLTNLTIHHDEGVSLDFEKLNGWAWLPSLRSIQCKRLYSFNPSEDPPRIDEIPSRQSLVTHLELNECVISEVDFETLLQRFKALRCFKYQYGTFATIKASGRTSFPPKQPWNPRGLIEILSTYASHSLVTLDLTRTGTPHLVHGHWLAGRIFVGSLRRFRLLQTLRADAIIFIESELENLIIEYAKAYRNRSHSELLARIVKNHKNLTNHARSLVNLLPPSLEELVLCSTNPHDGREVSALFQHAPVMKAQRIPRLKKIVFECKPPTAYALKAWREAGIQMYCLTS